MNSQKRYAIHIQGKAGASLRVRRDCATGRHYFEGDMSIEEVLATLVRSAEESSDANCIAWIAYIHTAFNQMLMSCILARRDSDAQLNTFPARNVH